MNTKKAEFIQLLAEGKTYKEIGQALGISKATASRWKKELKEETGKAEEESLKELYAQYKATTAARVKALGTALDQIENALAGADLSRTPPEKLLDLKLKYIRALHEEVINLEEPHKREALTAEEIAGTLSALLQAAEKGNINGAQLAKIISVLELSIKFKRTQEENWETWETV